MNQILNIENLNKSYKDFSLELSLTMDSGSIVALIGENGAGKTTLIKSIFGLIKPESGTIQYCGQDVDTLAQAQRNEIAVSFDGISLPDQFNSNDVSKMGKMMFSSWSQEIFNRTVEVLNIPKDKKIKELSKGMKAKLQLAYAFARNPKLIVLDEITSSMDPIVRDEVLELLQDFIVDEGKAVILSSHLTSDLEKVADRFIFIHKGRIILDFTKDDLDGNFAIIRGDRTTFVDPSHLIASRERNYSTDYLIDNKTEYLKNNPNAILDKPSIEEIMLIIAKKDN